MNRLTFWRLISGLSVVLTGCAESAIGADDEGATSDANAETDKLDGGADASGHDGATAGDAAGPDATAPAPDAARHEDAATPDAGGEPQDAGRDAAVPKDSGQPDAGAPPVTCSNGQTTCGGNCVDTKTDLKNCGGCGNACGGGQSCQDSQCISPGPQFNVPSGCSKQTYGQHGYAFCSNAASWSDARDACLGAGLDLAIVSDQGESDFVKGNGTSWIAVNDRSTEGRYQQVVPGDRNRVDGALASFNDWTSGQPAGRCPLPGITTPFPPWYCTIPRTDEDCVQLSSAGWSDEDCASRAGFVCEMY
jgi:hypothetical protein